MSGSPGEVTVVILFGRHSSTPASWRTARQLIGDGVTITAFFPNGVPDKRPRRVRAYPITPTPSSRRFRVRRWRVQRRLRRARRGGGIDAIWEAAAADDRLLEAVERADVLVAADRTAVPAVWHLMRLNKEADAVLGYGEAQARIGSRLAPRADPLGASPSTPPGAGSSPGLGAARGDRTELGMGRT